MPDPAGRSAGAPHGVGRDNPDHGKQKPRNELGVFHDTEHRLPDTSYDTSIANLVKHLAHRRVTRGGQGSRTLVAEKPLDRLAGGVQYPLAIPS
jgi:hypothetical protein